MKKAFVYLYFAAMACSLLTGCGSISNTSENIEEAVSTKTEKNDVEAIAEDETGETEEATAVGSEETFTAATLEDGIYSAEFDTDSSMFHVNEANEGKGVLTVENGQMIIHVSLVSKNIVNLFAGLAEDAGKEGAVLLEPVTDTVTYSDGISEEVYGFDIPVPVLNEEFDVAIIGTKGVWYDHKVRVSNPEKIEENEEAD